MIYIAFFFNAHKVSIQKKYYSEIRQISHANSMSESLNLHSTNLFENAE